MHLTASIPALCWLNSSELVVVLQNISAATRCNLFSKLLGHPENFEDSKDLGALGPLILETMHQVFHGAYLG